jgi:hypothetical protein
MMTEAIYRQTRRTQQAGLSRPRLLVHNAPAKIEKRTDLIAQPSARLGQILVAVVGLHPELGSCFQRRRVPSAAPHAVSF